MSKRKPAPASKHTHSPKKAAKAQRAAQEIVRSPRNSRPTSTGAGSTKTTPKRHIDSKQEALLVENSATALQEALLVEEPTVALPNDSKQTMTENDSKTGSDFSSVMANARAYQAKLLEMAQANMQFDFEFAQRLAAIRSPVELLSVIVECTSKRSAMFRKHSEELAELSTMR
jgi:hypothetical protein